MYMQHIVRKLLYCFLLTEMVIRVITLPLNDDWDALIRRRRDATNCQPPSNIEELFIRLNQNVDKSTYLRLASTTDTQRPFLHDELNMDQVEESQYYGSRTCPTTVSDDPSDPLWMRSLCPWYYNVTELPQGHYPRVIPQAICKCPNCIDNDLNQCEQMKTNIRVLVETGCQHGFYTYKPKTVATSVGCTCAKRRIVFSESGSSGSETKSSLDCGYWGCKDK